jgi:hypothetical protein
LVMGFKLVDVNDDGACPRRSGEGTQPLTIHEADTNSLLISRIQSRPRPRVRREWASTVRQDSKSRAPI